MVFPWILINAVVFYLLIVRPALNFKSYPRWKSRIEELGSPARIQYYLRMIWRGLIPTAFAGLSLWSFHVTFSQAGFELPNWADVTTLSIGSPWIVFLYVWVVLMYFMMPVKHWLRLLFLNRAFEQQTKNDTPKVDLIAPVINQERRLWVLVSVVVAVTDQFLFIGFVAIYLKMIWPADWWWGLMVPAVAVLYGMLRIHAGWKSVYQSIVAGFIHAVMFMMTHSLLPSIVIVFLINSYFAMRIAPIQSTPAKRSQRRVEVVAYYMTVLLVAIGVNTYIRHQPIDAPVLLQSPAADWTTLNHSQRIQVVQASLKLHHYSGTQTPQQVIAAVDTWEQRYDPTPSIELLLGPVMTMDALIQASVVN